jgi:hypothetical protein
VGVKLKAERLKKPPSKKQQAAREAYRKNAKTALSTARKLLSP